MDPAVTMGSGAISAMCFHCDGHYSHETGISSMPEERNISADASVDGFVAKRIYSLNKPNLTYLSMIVTAINSVPERELTLGQIYDYMRRQWSDTFTGEYTGWKNTVRHTLTLNECFVKIPKEDGTTRKGHKWTLVDGWQSMFENLGGVYRPRRRQNHLDRTPDQNASQSIPHAICHLPLSLPNSPAVSGQAHEFSGGLTSPWMQPFHHI